VNFALQKMESSVIRLRLNRLIDTRVRLVESVLRRVETDETAERIKVSAIDRQRAVVEADPFVDLVLCERDRSKIDVNVGTLGQNGVTHRPLRTGQSEKSDRASGLRANLQLQHSRRPDRRIAFRRARAG